MNDLLIFYLIIAIFGLIIAIISLPGILEMRRKRKKQKKQ